MKGTEEGKGRAAGWLDVAVLAAFALGLRLIDLGHPPDIDELHHVLAARSLLADGTLSINGGVPYDRAVLFTYLVAGLFAVFGESLQVARMPAVFAGTALVVVLFLWVRSVGGRTAAWVAALLAAVYPNGVFLSQLSRFYTLQVLLFLVGTIAVYRLVTSAATLRPRTRVALAGAAVVSWATAVKFQMTCIVGIAAVVTWALIAAAPDVWRWLKRQRHATWMIAGALAVVLLAAALVVRNGTLINALNTFRYADPWAAEHRDNVRFYHWFFLEQFPTAWTLLPVAAIIAIAAFPRMGTLCASVFGLAFVFHSLAAWKHDRYIAYAIPMFFGLTGLAAARVLPPLKRAAEAVVARLPGVNARPALVRWGAGALLAGCVLFAMIGNGAFPTVVRMLAPSSGATPRPFRGQADWGAAAEQLRAIADSVDVVVGSSDMKSIYFLGRVDYILEAQRLYINGEWTPEFTIHAKLDRPAISKPESLSRIMQCEPSGLIVTEYGQWKQTWGIPAPMADYLVANTERILESDEWRIRAFRWDRSMPGTAECDQHNGTGNANANGNANGER